MTPAHERPRTPQRSVHRADAFEWLASRECDEDVSVVTSLPDWSEVRELELDAYRGWFTRAARSVLEWVSPSGVVIFFQTDVRRRGVWLDKSYLVLKAAEETEARLLWHKVICRQPPGTITHGPAGYSHLLCFTKRPAWAPVSNSPDVLADGGMKPTEKSMGALACLLACRFALEQAGSRVILDPFCGHGTVLAVANRLGLDAIGVDRSERACRSARRFELDASALGGSGALVEQRE